MHGWILFQILSKTGNCSVILIKLFFLIGKNTKACRVWSDENAISLQPFALFYYRTWRLAAYRQFTWWVHGILGKKRRRAIPSCVVHAIRKRFPEESGDYVGFKEAELFFLNLLTITCLIIFSYTKLIHVYSKSMTTIIINP